MARQTLEMVRDNVDSRRIMSGALAEQQQSKLNIIIREAKRSGDLNLWQHKWRQGHENKQAAESERIKRLTHRAKLEKDAKNGKAPEKRVERPPKRKDYRSPVGFELEGIRTGQSFASRSAEIMESKQSGFPDVMRHPFTIHLAVVPVASDLSLIFQEQRTRLRKSLKALTPGFQVSGKFQFIIKTSEYIATIIPEDEWPKEMDPIARPDDLFALVHIHGIVADPFLSKRAVREILVNSFPGCRRVRVDYVLPEIVTKRGERTRGAQGYFEYASMEKTDVQQDSPKQTKEATIYTARLGSTINRRNRIFSMGKSLDVTGVKIDPARVGELQLNERISRIKKNWSKLDYYIQFLFTWFSGGSLIARYKKVPAFLDIRYIFGFLLDSIYNWCLQENSEVIEFADYFNARLE